MSFINFDPSQRIEGKQKVSITLRTHPRHKEQCKNLRNSCMHGEEKSKRKHITPRLALLSCAIHTIALNT